ncbi:MAG: ABC transporter ATP-binding protein [Lachnospiraceae bacterium]|nr:ABC transporter ATP-binding protein [Lachnospiraceae bacterium]
MKILEAKKLKKYYGEGDVQVRALDGVNLGIEEGEFCAIVGTSGSGKSTLLHMLGGLDYATSGSVTVAGKKIFELNENELTIFRRRHIGFIFQSYNLVPILSIYENIVLPLELDGRPVDETFVRDIVQTLGLQDKLNNLPGQLSGGQQQRVAIARALVTKPAIILADEPTGNLDSKTTQEVLGLLKLTGEQFHQTIVMITHNEALAQLCDRVIHIEDGKIVDDRLYEVQTLQEKQIVHGEQTMRNGGASNEEQ